MMITRADHFPRKYACHRYIEQTAGGFIGAPNMHIALQSMLRITSCEHLLTRVKSPSTSA
jgi:hypothetical protein